MSTRLTSAVDAEVSQRLGSEEKSTSSFGNMHEDEMIIEAFLYLTLSPAPVERDCR